MANATGKTMSRWMDDGAGRPPGWMEEPGHQGGSRWMDEQDPFDPDGSYRKATQEAIRRQQEQDEWDRYFVPKKDKAHTMSTAPKTLHNSTISQAKDNVGDLKVVGNGNMFRLLCKASSEREGWMKSTKAMEIPGVGCVVQVTTQQDDNVAEALTFVPGVKIVDDENGGRRLESISPYIP